MKCCKYAVTYGARVHIYEIHTWECAVKQMNNLCINNDDQWWVPFCVMSTHCIYFTLMFTVQIGYLNDRKTKQQKNEVGQSLGSMRLWLRLHCYLPYQFNLLVAEYLKMLQFLFFFFFRFSSFFLGNVNISTKITQLFALNK